MATTLSYGYVKPQTGDTGSTFFPAMEENIQQLNDHNHDGVNSALLNSSALGKGLVVAASGSWTLVSTGLYEQTLTVPAGYNINTSNIYSKVVATNDIAYPETQKLSATQFKIFSNTNTIGFNVYFG